MFNSYARLSEGMFTRSRWVCWVRMYVHTVVSWWYNMVFYTEYLVGFKQQYEMGEFHSHGNTPIAGWFISWKIPKKNG
jgi:hypothetical protein